MATVRNLACLTFRPEALDVHDLPHYVYVVFERPLTDRNIHRSFQKKYRVYIIASEARSLTQNLH